MSFLSFMFEHTTYDYCFNQEDFQRLLNKLYYNFPNGPRKWIKQYTWKVSSAALNEYKEGVIILINNPSHVSNKNAVAVSSSTLSADWHGWRN